MLVLSRRIGETIQIDGNITLEVLKCSDGRVKLGIVAPADRRICRSEIAHPEFSEVRSSRCPEEALLATSSLISVGSE